jgi:hypothetical protein
MANILSLALKINADASGLRLTPVERALKRLGDETTKVTSVFDKFTATSAEAARAQEATARAIDELTKARQANTLTAQQFAAEFAKVSDAAKEQAEAFSEGVRIAEQFRTSEERNAIALERVNRLRQQGAIDQETYNRAVAEYSGANAEAARASAENARQESEAAKVQAEALRQRQALESRAAQIINANLTSQERYEQQLRELNALQQAGVLVGENYNRAVAAARKPLEDAAAASAKVADAGKQSTLQFNELSGIFAVLPGPLGNIAGRMSGIASASEGLSRIFAGGLRSGITNVVGSFTALVNPVTASLAGLAAFGAGATAVARGLVSLEDRVERLGRLANQLGVSFEFVQVLEEAGKRADVSIEQLSRSFARLQNTLSGADEESKKASEALQRLGVSVQDFGALSEEQRIELIGERLAQIEDPAQRSAAAIALFGRSGVQLLPFFNELPGAATDMERIGRAVTDLDRQNLADFGASIDALKLATQGLGTSLLLPFVGLAEGITQAIAEIVAGITAIVDPIGRLLGPSLSQIGVIVEAIGVGLGALAQVFGVLARAVEPVAQFLLPAVVAQLVALNRVAIANAISGLATGFASAATAAIAYATSAGTATGATIALGAAIRGLLASTGVGALVVGAGLAANALFGWFSSADEAADGMGKVEDSTKTAADEAARLAEELAKDDAALAESAAKAIDDVRGKLSEAVDASLEFGQAGFDAAVQYQTAIADLEKQLDRGIINEETFRRQSEAARQAYDDQIAIAEQAAARIEENTRRVDGLLAKANEIPKIEQDINAIESEIARVEADLAAARESGATAQADALASRLAQLDQLQAGLLDQQDEAAQGFAQGFDAAFASVDKGINSLIDKAGEFGNEGSLAAQQLADGIAAAQEQVKDGILNREAFEAEVERQKKLFEDRLADLRQLEQINNRIAEGEGKIRDRQFEIELARAEELATVRTGSVEIQDIRSGGISAFFDTLKEDPAIAEAKKQTKELEAMRKELAKLNADKVDILQGTG